MLSGHRGGNLVGVTKYPGLPGEVQVYDCCPHIIIHCVTIYSPQLPGLDDKLCYLTFSSYKTSCSLTTTPLFLTLKEQGCLSDPKVSPPNVA